jgi:hypothetical protein
MTYAEITDEHLLVLHRAKEKHLLLQYVRVTSPTEPERSAILYGFHADAHGTLLAVVASMDPRGMCDLVHYSHVKELRK